MPYRIEVYKNGWLSYSWHIYKPGATQPFVYGPAFTRRDAIRAARNWVDRAKPVLVKEVD